jgi:opacity protein-like surface antigen
MQNKLLIFVFFISCLLNPAFAETELPVWEAQIQAGAAFVHSGNANLGVTTSETDTLASTNDPTAFHGGVGVGYLRPLKKTPENWNGFTYLKPAINFYFLSTMHFEGDVYEFQEPSLNNDNYQMNVQSQRFMFDLSTDLLNWKNWSITGLAGLGIAWNESKYSDYGNQSFNQGERLTLNRYTAAQFAWEVGAGLRYQMSEKWSLSLDYLYTDLGKAKTGSSIKNSDIAHPSISSGDFRIRSNSILLSLQMDLGNDI